MIRLNRWHVRFFAAIGILLWNVAWPMSLFIRSRLSRSTPSQEYSGEFHGEYAIYVTLGPKDDYVNTPFCWMVGEHTRLKLSISPEKIVLTTKLEDGYEWAKTYNIGQDVVYLGGDRFVFYWSSLNFGQMFPGTTYSTTACQIEVSPESLSVEAEENQVGLGLFLHPKTLKYTFSRVFPSLDAEGTH